MIRENTNHFLREFSSSPQVREAMASDIGYLQETWQRCCDDMGWQLLLIPEQAEGLGMGRVTLAVVLEEMGRRLFCSPFFATAVLATNALLECASPEQQQHWLPQLAAGKTATLAHQEPHVHCYNFNGLTTNAIKRGNEYVLNGHKRGVVDGHTAELLVVSAQLPETKELGVFVLPSTTPGVSRRALASMDQTRHLGELHFTDVVLTEDALLKNALSSHDCLQTTLELAAIGLAAEQTGAAAQCLDMTLEYIGERVQFGRTIASFQAVKHRCADMMLAVEASRSACYYASCVADLSATESNYQAQLLEAATTAKSYCSETFFSVAAESLQLYGGVGFTWEYDVHLYFKRARASEAMFGNADFHRERLSHQLLEQNISAKLPA